MSGRYAVAADLAVAFALGGAAGLALGIGDLWALPLCGLAAAIWIAGTQDREVGR